MQELGNPTFAQAILDGRSVAVSCRNEDRLAFIELHGLAHSSSMAEQPALFGTWMAAGLRVR